MTAPNVCNAFVSTARAATALALLGFTLSGCGKPATDSAAAPAGATAATADADHDHAGESHEGHDHGGDVAAALAKLSPEDRALAEAQKVCVVAKEPLGSMGAPIKVEHNGQVAFLCCDGCREAFEADPEKYLAGLSKDAGEGAADAPADADAAPAAEPATGTPAEGT